MDWRATVAIRFFIGNLLGASYEMRDVDGEGVEEECISIPLRRNGIIKIGGGALMNMTLTKTRNNVNRSGKPQTHFLSVNLKSDIRKEVRELGYEDRLRFIGDGNEMTSEYYEYMKSRRKKH